MRRPLIISVLFFSLSSFSQAQAPDASTIQQAMNQRIELEFPYFQEVADVIVLQGGVTVDGDVLFLGSGRLVWKLSNVELMAVLQQEIVEQVERLGGGEELWIALNTALTTRLNRIDPFQAGDTATLVRFRVRLEQAGADWIVTDSKLKESVRNPMKVLEE
jgi:hypothetical protein